MFKRNGVHTPGIGLGLGGVLMLMSWGGEMGVLMSSAISGVQKIWCPYHRDRVGVG